MDLIKNTLEILEVDPNFTVKERTVKSDPITAEQLISKVILDGGKTKMTELFKGHDQIKIRQAFKLTFYAAPKPNPNLNWYLYILSLNGMRKCPACGAVKTLNLFSKNRCMEAAGVDSWCLDCKKEYRLIHKDSLAKTKALWQKNNRHKTIAAAAKYRAAKFRAVPAWANLKYIEEIYANCPEGYHVDHWAPLQGSNVCGLHVEANLQYIKAKDNISKSNKFSDTNPFYGTDI